MLPAPPDIEVVFDTPGHAWTRDDRERVKVWLNQPPQRGRLLRFSALHLGHRATAQDAEETWQAFAVAPLDDAIDRYDPSRGRRFASWLLLLLTQDCSRARKKIEKRAEVPLTPVDDEGGPMEVDVPDPGSETERQKVERITLRRCLSALPALYGAVIAGHYFEEKPVDEIARQLRISGSNVKIRLFRARKWLRRCLEGQPLETPAAGATA